MKCTSQQHTESTRFDTGDFKIAVQWYERVLVAGLVSGGRLDFQPEAVKANLINSTELCHADFRMKNITDTPPPRLPAAARRSSGALTGASVDEKDGGVGCSRWRLCASVEEEGLRWCR